MFLNGWHPFESIRFDLVKITICRCLVLQNCEQQKQLIRKQRVIQQDELSKKLVKLKAVEEKGNGRKTRVLRINDILGGLVAQTLSPI